MVAALVQSRWTDLPPDLLGLVLSRVLSHADRVRLRAVCRAWRSGARTVQHLLPPFLPWAALRDGTFLSLPDGAVHRMTIPEDVSRRLCAGGMLFVVHRDGRRSLMHPQSGDAAPQEVWMTASGLLLNEDIRKVVVADHFVAVLTSGRRTSKNLTIYARGGAEYMGVKWAKPGNFRPAADIALLQGKLYVLTAAKTYSEYVLYVLDITGSDEQGGISVTSVRRIIDTEIPRDHTPECFLQIRFYLVVSGDRLLMVEQTINRRGPDWARMPSRFLVLEAADLDGQARWCKVDALMGHALFVSEGCSESLPVGGAGAGGAREDCIYFMSECYRVLQRYGARVRRLQYERRDCGVAVTAVKDVGGDIKLWSMASDMAFSSWNLTLLRSNLFYVQLGRCVSYMLTQDSSIVLSRRFDIL